MGIKYELGKIRNAVTWQELKPEQKKLRFLRNLIMNKEVEPMEDFLNRLLFDKPWTDNNHLKSFQYLDTFWHGAWNVEKFIFVPAELIRTEMLGKLKTSKNKEVIEQLRKGLTIIEDKINRKIKYLIIDGMGRTLTTWKPFFKGEPWARIPNSDIIESITIDYPDGSEEEVNGKMWVDLSDYAQETLLEGGIDVAVVESGELGKITMCLVSKNNNEKFTPWQLLYHSQFISPFALHIKNALTEPIRDFLKEHTTIDKTTYKHGKSGHEHFIGMLLLYLAKQKVAKVDKLFVEAFEENSTLVLQKHVDQLKTYLMELVDAFPKQVVGGKYKTGFIRNYIVLRDAIDNRKNKDMYYALACSNIRELSGKIAETKQFVVWFIKKHEYLSGKYWNGPDDEEGNPTRLINYISWYKQDDKFTALDGGYFKSTSDDNDSNFADAIRHLVIEFNASIEMLYDDNTWKMTTRSDTPSIREVASFRNWEDRHGNKVDPEQLGDYIKGHVIPEKEPHSETLVHKLVLQKKLGNSQYAGRPLIN